MGRVVLLNNNVFVFVAVIVVVVAILSFYNMVGPETNTVPFNFDPFPKITPSRLPDPSHQTDNCWNKLTACDSAGQCSSCSDREYKCVNVSQGQADRKFYHFNGINVPKGSWCLPKDDNPNPICNSYTGRWVWSFDPEYCASVNAKGQQCWKCQCLYPNLFSGSSQGCNSSTACQNDSPLNRSATLVQTGNKLIATTAAKDSLQGCVWDPTNDKANPENKCQDIYNYSPLDQDKNGQPWFSCSCQDNQAGQYFANLPNDPQTCHLEPCYKYLGNSIKGLTCSGDNCSCICDNTNMALSPNGKYGGTCVSIINACGHFGWNKDDKECACGNGPYWPRKCKSSTTGVNMDDSTLPDCTLPENALGSECYNPCEAKTCNHNSVCISCGQQSSDEISMCQYQPDSGSFSTDKTIHSVCDCSLGDVPPNSQNYGGYYGPTCSLACLKADTVVNTHTFFDSGDHRVACNCCCSLRTKDVNDFWVISSSDRCDGSWPTKDKPADPNCLPIPKDQCPDKHG